MAIYDCIWLLPLRLWWLRFYFDLLDEWLTLVDLEQQQEAELNYQNQADYWDGATPHRATYDAPNHREPPQDDTAIQRAPHDAPDQDGTTAP